MILTPYQAPEEGVVHQEPMTEAYIDDKSYGNGSIFITENCVTWIGAEGSGFKLAYPNISIHAVSRDTAAFPHECLYMMLDIALEDRMIEDGEESDEEANQSTEVRFIPSQKEHLDVMYRAMCACQELHPDPEQDDSDDDYYGDHDCMIGDGPELSAQGINNLHRMEQMLANGDGPAQQNGGQNGDTDQQENMDDAEDGQFEDA